MSTFLRSHILSVLREEGLPDCIDLQVISGSKEGEHFMCVTHKIVGSSETVDGKTESRHLFVKSIPKYDSRKIIFQPECIFKKEITFYEVIVPVFVNFQKKHCVPLDGNPSELELNLFPKCFRALRSEVEDFIIMEDLSECGFVIEDRLEGLDLEKSLLTMRCLARFHALSYAMKEKEPAAFKSIKALATESIFLERNERQFGSVFQKNAESALMDIKEWVPEAAVNRLESWIKVGVFKQMSKLINKRDDFAVINHGDCWINNIFFSFGDPSSPQLRFIDFQVIRYASSAIDLSYFIFTSIRKDVREKHFDDVLKEYYSTLMLWMDRFGCTHHRGHLTYKHLQEKISEFSLFGLGQALIFVPLYHASAVQTAEERASKDEILGDVVTLHSKELKKEVVLEKLSSMVKQCYEKGYL